MGNTFQMPDFMREDYALTWLMTVQEQAALVQLLNHVKPPVALEIGTNRGGSLQVIAPRAQRVYALDINPQVPKWLGKMFPNVSFHIGDSTSVLPAVLREIEARGEDLGFVLIDGDHTGKGVRQDIEAILNYKPRRPVYIAMHDSFNPDCRNGMQTAAWQACPYVHYVQLDYVRGKITPCDGGFEMWGGLGLALMLPERRTGAVTIRVDGWQMFETVRDCPYLPRPMPPQGVLNHLKGLCQALPGLPLRMLRRLRHGGAKLTCSSGTREAA